MVLMATSVLVKVLNAKATENTDKMEELSKVRAAYNMDGTPDEEVAENDDEANKSEINLMTKPIQRLKGDSIDLNDSIKR